MGGRWELFLEDFRAARRGSGRLGSEVAEVALEFLG